MNYSTYKNLFVAPNNMQHMIIVPQIATSMSFEKKDLINAFNLSIKNLQQGIDVHCCLVASILEEQVDERNILPLLNLCPKRSREIILENAIKETIGVLEESRKAFKSKRLESLRKKLTGVLIDS